MPSANGGVAGEVKFPDYLETDHQHWIDFSGATTLDQNVTSLVKTLVALVSTPYAAATITNPTTELQAIKTRYDTVETIIDALNEQVDWKAIILEAASEVDDPANSIQKATAQVLATLRGDVDTLLTDGDTLFGTGIGGLGIDEIRSHDTILDEIVASIDTAGVLPVADIATMLDSALTETNDFYAQLTAKITQATNIDPKTIWAALADKAKVTRDLAGYITLLDFATMLTSAQSEAGTEVAAAIAAAAQADDVTPTTDYNSYVDEGKTLRDTAGYVDEIDFATIIANAQTEAAAEVTAAIDAAAAASLPDPDGDYDSYIDLTKTLRDLPNYITKTVFSTIATNAGTEAASEVTAAIAAAAQADSPDSTTDYDAMGDAAVVLRDTLNYIDEIDFSSDLSTAQTEAASEVSAAIAAAAQATVPTPTTDIDAYIDQAKTSRDLAGYVNKPDHATSLTNAKSEAATLITSLIGDADAAIQSAATEGQAAIAQAVLDAISAKISTATAPDRAVRRRRFAGGMADINAANSSAFLFGLALIDAQESAESEAVLADRAISVYSSVLQGVFTAGMQLRTQLIINLLNLDLTNDQRIMEVDANFLLQAASAQIALRRIQADAEIAREQIQTGLRSQVMRDILVANVDADRANMIMQSDFIIQAAAGMVELRRAKAQIEIAREQIQTGLRAGIFNNLVNANVSADVANMNMESSFLIQGASGMVDLRRVQAQIETVREQVQTGLRTSYVRDAINANVAAERANMEMQSGFLLNAASVMADLRRTKASIETAREQIQTGMRRQYVKDALDANVAADATNLRTEAGFVLDGARDMVQLQRLETQIETIREQLEGRSYTDAYRGSQEMYVRGGVMDKTVRADVLQRGVEAVFSAEKAKNDIKSAFFDLYARAFTDHQRSLTQKTMADEVRRDELVLQSMQGMLLMKRFAHDLEMRSVNELNATQRALAVGRGEYEMRELDRDVKDAFWDLDATLHGSRILGAVTGNSALVPRGPSQASSALGGVFGGAGAGAGVGFAVGGPPGAAIGAGVGALVGGVAGLLN